LKTFFYLEIFDWKFQFSPNHRYRRTTRSRTFATIPVMSQGDAADHVEEELLSDDRPNLSIGDDREVHLKLGQQPSEEGSIIAATPELSPIDPTKDPKISPLPGPEPKEPQSKCCLLL
jgi:hypothetical protein